MANGTYYADSVNGNDGNAGTSEGAAKQTLSALFGLGTGGGNTYYVQAGGNYTLTSTATFSTSGDTTDGPNVIEGYTTTPGARDGRPTITSATDSVNLISLDGTDNVRLVHLSLTHTAGTRGNGVHNLTGTSSNVRVEDCVIDGCAVGVYAAFEFRQLALEDVEVKNCTSHGVSVGAESWLAGCWLHDNAGDGYRNGFYSGANGVGFYRCKFTGNGGYGVNLSGNFGFQTGHIDLLGCTFSDNDSGGFRDAEGSGGLPTYSVRDNAFYGEGGYGMSAALSGGELAARIKVNDRNAYGSHTSGSRNNWPAGVHDVSLSADPFANAAGGDYAPNSTAGGGASLRAAGTGSADIGAVQHQDAGGSSGGGPLFGGRLIG